MVLADYKFNILDRMPDHYFKNVARVQARRPTRPSIEIIPAVFPIGYSDGLLAHDPNLAEGLPVKDAPFVVKGGEAVLVPRAGRQLVNGGLEETKGDTLRRLRLPGRSGQGHVRRPRRWSTAARCRAGCRTSAGDSSATAG